MPRRTPGRAGGPMRDREIDEAALLARRGIRPESVPDFLALVGDTADGIPGLAGSGRRPPRRCSPARPPRGHPARCRALARGVRGAAARGGARDGREAALLFRRLATLVPTCRSGSPSTTCAGGVSRARGSRRGATSSARVGCSPRSRRVAHAGPMQAPGRAPPREAQLQLAGYRNSNGTFTSG